jgi:hypothetical protein
MLCSRLKPQKIFAPNSPDLEVGLQGMFSKVCVAMEPSPARTTPALDSPRHARYGHVARLTATQNSPPDASAEVDTAQRKHLGGVIDSWTLLWGRGRRVGRDWGVHQQPSCWGVGARGCCRGVEHAQQFWCSGRSEKSDESEPVNSANTGACTDFARAQGADVGGEKSEESEPVNSANTGACTDFARA